GGHEPEAQSRHRDGLPDGRSNPSGHRLTLGKRNRETARKRVAIRASRSRTTTEGQIRGVVMRLGGVWAAALALTLFAMIDVASAQQAPDPRNWRPVDPENTLYIDTVHGRIVIEMYPEVAPNHVERIKALTRAHFYDGLTFHRVVDGFMAQTGDPLG